MSFIYLLDDPTDISLTCYIGKSNAPNKRFSQHISSNALKKNTLKAHWISAMISRGIKPRMTIIEETDNWIEAEQFYIAYYKFIGMHLCNSTSGGNGWEKRSGMPCSPETKAKISASKKGTKTSMETRAKMSIAKKLRAIYYKSPLNGMIWKKINGKRVWLNG